jgi:hypothetical protein
MMRPTKLSADIVAPSKMADRPYHLVPRMSRAPYAALTGVQAGILSNLYVLLAVWTVDSARYSCTSRCSVRRTGLSLVTVLHFETLNSRVLYISCTAMRRSPQSSSRKGGRSGQHASPRSTALTVLALLLLGSSVHAAPQQQGVARRLLQVQATSNTPVNIK